MIQEHIVKREKRTFVHQFFHAKNSKMVVAGWRLDLDEIRRVFTVRSFTSP